jgi:hypothetical protein
MSVIHAALELKHAAIKHGLRHDRLWVGYMKAAQLQKEFKEFAWVWPNGEGAVEGVQQIHGMTVTYQNDPGMAVG